MKEANSTIARTVLFLSIALLFFAVPHTLEDFATGEPAEAGVPAEVLSMVVALVISLQAVAIYLLGRRSRTGLVLHALVGLFWPVASGIAQLPTIFEDGVYRSGAISVIWVFGLIAIGLAILVASLVGLLRR